MSLRVLEATGMDDPRKPQQLPLPSPCETASNGDGKCSEDAVAVCLPPPSETDPLFAKKMNLLSSKNLRLEFQLQVSFSSQELLLIFHQIVQTARVLHLNETELYFVEDDDFGPFTSRNELESLNLILSVIKPLVSGAEDSEAKVLQAMQELIAQTISSVSSNRTDKMISDGSASNVEELLVKWGADHGVKTKLKISHFKGAGRGAVASEYINVGDTALEIPESLIISEDVVYESDMFDILKEIDGISADTMLLLWSMKERHNPSSKFKIYFETLPEEYNTGLSFGIDALTELEGTLLFDEIFQAKEHLWKQFNELCPNLCAAHPEIFQPGYYTWDCFLWACELWYSNGMKVIFNDGKLRTCLVPIAGLLNHSLDPHILHYGRVDSASHSLKFKLSRPCKSGEQCYLSYGSYPSSHLITFYGFMPDGENPYDVIPLDFDDSDDGSGQLQNCETGWATHMVRGTWLSKNNMAPNYGLPSPMLAHLRALLRDAGTESSSDVHDKFNISNDHERVVLETIKSIFEPMLEGLGDLDENDREISSLDVKLSLEYKYLQRRIISSVLSACSQGLDALNSL